MMGHCLMVVAAPILRQVDLKAIGAAVQLDAAIEEAGILRRLAGVLVRHGGLPRRHRLGTPAQPGRPAKAR
jgi:hypothetical protein